MQARRNLVWALAALAVIQFLHGLDELRTDDAQTLVGTLTEPAGVLGLGATLVTLVAVVRGVSWGRPMAVVTGVGVALGFVVVHGIPTASEVTSPYWGDGSADALQWIGVIAVWLACAAVVVAARATGWQRAPDSLEPSS